jgi:hypothetical protein
MTGMLDRPFARSVLPLLCVMALSFVYSAPVAASTSRDGVWRDQGEASIARTPGGRRIVPLTYRTLALARAELDGLLGQAPLEDTVALRSAGSRITLPLADGSFGEFQFVESPIMEPGLAVKFPDVHTYLGQGVDDPGATVRFDLTPLGFHAQIISWQGTTYIDPFQTADTEHYIAYSKRDMRGERPRCLVTGEELPVDAPDPSKRGVATKISSGTQRRTYRLALAATAEYTAFQGGTVALAQAAEVTTMNRVNGIYERELSVRMLLVANNNLLIYTNAATDPYTNGSPNTMIGQNQTNITTVIGSANYDIGHVVATNSGGLAGLGVVCNAGNKARGVTGSGAPTGDPFDVDYVAHEMGHQFGGNHSFNGCDGNRNMSTAYEPASGSTIQAYAGICGADDLQPHSDDYFHRVSLNEMLNFTVSGGGNGCAGQNATGNTAPVVAGPGNFTIPRQTPFTLTATGSDVNNDTLTYDWEQFDLGAANPLGSLVDNGGPLFRSFSPKTSPSRTFPSLNFILANANVAQWELLPSTNRTMNFRVTARDNRAGGGGTNEASTAITVNATAGPFVVTVPNTGVSWAGNVAHTVTWNVAGTSAAPINTATVKILLSLDGGNTFPLTLATGEPNDGSASVMLFGATPTSQARIKVQAENNIYFDIGNTNFTITSNGPVGATVAASGGTTLLAEGGATDTYTIALRVAPTAGVTVSIVPDAQLTTSPTSLSFTTANWATPQTVTVTAFNDLIAEGAHTGSIAHTASGGNYTGASIAGITANITDNDTAAVTLVQSGGTTAVAEGGATDSYTLVLGSQPTASVTVNIATDAQVSVSPSSRTFTTSNWNTPQSVTVTAVNDLVVEPTHNGVLTHTATGGGYAGVSIGNVTASITDNDTASVGTVGLVQAEGNSGSSTMKFTLQLAGQVAGGFTVNYATRNDTAIAGQDYVAATGSVTFDGTLNAARDINIGVLGDLSVEPNEQFFLDLSTTRSGVSFLPAAVPGQIINDDVGADGVFANGYE